MGNTVVDGGAMNAVQRGDGTIVTLTNDSYTTSNGGATISAADEQGIRAFLFKLLNSRHIFTNNDIVDQIEAFV